MKLLRAIACAFKPFSGKSCSHDWDDYLDGAAYAMFFDGEVPNDKPIPFGVEGFKADAAAIWGYWFNVGQYLRSAMDSIDP